MIKFLVRTWLSFTLLVTKAFYAFKNRFIKFFQDKVLTKKILFTIMLLAIFVIAGTITVPGIKIGDRSTVNSSSFFGVLNIVGGGGLTNFSVVALGISPFITSSLIMMILQTKIFPPIHRLSQSGPQGRIKINIITRFLTFFIAIIQAIVLIRTLTGESVSTFAQILDKSNTYKYFTLPTILIAGSLFALFLSEQITNYGVGNGTSLIIFTGIATRLPSTFRTAYEYLVGVGGTNDVISGIIYFGTYILFFLFLVFIVAYMYLAERHIPIQQVGAGLTKSHKDISFLPIKVNPAGVMPLIFSLIVVSFPLLIAGLLDPYTSFTRQWIENNLKTTDPIGFVSFIVITFIFSIFMGLQQSRIDKIAEDFSKNSTFIPGIRPGEDTEDYLISVVLRLSTFSAFYLTIIGSMQFVQQMLGMPRQITLGGTSIIILISTALETMGQISARMKSNQLSIKKRHTIAFMQKQKQNKKNFKNGDILW